MKKVLLALTVASAVTSSMIAQGAESKFDLSSRFIIDQYQALVANPNAPIMTSLEMPFSLDALSRGSEPVTAVFVTLNDGYTADDLVYGTSLEISNEIGNVATVYGPMSELIALDGNRAAKFISFGDMAKPCLNNAREATYVDPVHQGTGLSQAYKGAGVVTGIFDSGVDPNHVNFYSNNGAGDTRVKAVYNYTGTTGNGSVRTYDTPSTIAGFSTDNASGTHGTHTLGCMAGGFNGKGGKWARISNPSTGSVVVSATQANPYYGVATESDIVIGCGGTYSPNITAGIQKVFDYARANGKPAVVNISLGTLVGSHDGSDSFSAQLAELGKKGIICLAAGNDGDMMNSFVHDFTPSTPVFKTFITPANTNSGKGSIQIWGKDDEILKVTLFIYNLSTKSVVYSYPITDRVNKTLLGNASVSGVKVTSTQFEQAFTNSYLSFQSTQNYNSNARFEFMLDFSLTYKNTNANKNLVMGLQIEGSNGAHCDATMQANGSAIFSSLNQPGFTDGDGSMTISNMACGENIIVVGAYNTRSVWPSLNKGAWGYNDPLMKEGLIAPYSSWGILADGRTLPDVVAPGSGIISSYSKYYTEGQLGSNYTNEVSAEYTDNVHGGRKSYWASEQGTSMATPVFAGIVALWLQADPNLTVDKVKEIIKSTSAIPATANVPTERSRIAWGAGLVNALEGIKLVIKNAGGVQGIHADGEANLMVTPLSRGSFELMLQGADYIDASLYNMSGALVARTHENGYIATISADNAPAGVYILKVNGLPGQRVIIK